MNNWLKIENNTFYVNECDVQLSTESWAIIYLVLDIKRYPKYYDYFLNIYEKGKLFNINTIKFFAKNCRIKTIDIEFREKISMSIRCEDINVHSIHERRDGIIDDILGDVSNFYDYKNLIFNKKNNL